MVVVMKERAADEQVQRVIAQLVEMGFDVHRSTGALRTVLGAVGGNRQFDQRLLEVLDGVQEVHRITEPYKLASRTFKPENTVITVGDVRIGGDEVIVMAGPCSAETDEQVMASAAAAVPVDGFFIETHPEPSKAKSDAASMLPLDQLPGLLERVVRVLAAVRSR